MDTQLYQAGLISPDQIAEVAHRIGFSDEVPSQCINYHQNNAMEVAVVHPIVQPEMSGQF